jgi:hypothetical protein
MDGRLREPRAPRRRIAGVLAVLASAALFAGTPCLAAAPPNAATEGSRTDPLQVVDPSPPVPAREPMLMRCLLPTQLPDHLDRCLTSTNPLYHVYTLLMVALTRGTPETTSGYDLESPIVVTPLLVAALEGPLGRWGVHASMRMDVDTVSAASADVIASASAPRPLEVHYAPSLGGHKKFGDVDVNLQGSVSDRLAISAGGGVSVDLRRKTIMPSLDYSFSREILGRPGTPLAVFSHDVLRQTIDAATAFALDEATLFVPALTMVIENGDTSASSRIIPLFSSETAAHLPAGASPAVVRASQLPEVVLEQLPHSRQRVALAGLFAHRFSSTTLRAEERLYVDSWGVKASTTRAQVLIDASTRIRLWPEVRAHAQTGADFWQRAYVGGPIASGFVLPSLRTDQADLGPVLSMTGGAGVRLELDEKGRFALTVNGDVSYTRFLDHLYVVDRISYAGATALEVDIP